jgi:alpha-glucosidase (family GH31 glycosyl hydrolase)
VRVYLPRGEWRRFPGGEPVMGGQVREFRLALDEIAVFARAGTVIPLGPGVKHTGQLGAAPRATEAWKAP